METNVLNELNKIRDFYSKDALQKRFSALICGETGSGKTYLLRSCRRPIHIDSFDPGGTKCLKEWIDSGDIIVDTRWEDENPNAPDKFALWKKATDYRIATGYFKHFGTYALDSATNWTTSAMYAQTEGGIPSWNKDYIPVKNDMNIYIKKLLSIPCDLFLLGHLDKKEKVLSVDTKTGIRRTEDNYRFLTIGKAVTTIPLQFDEVYVIQTESRSSGLERYLLTEAQGEYIARSRLSSGKKLSTREPADIKALLRKVGFDAEDKPRLDTLVEEK